MRRSERDEWVADLRSGEFPQYTGGLLRVTMDNGKDGFCCLGVKLERDARVGRHGIVWDDDNGGYGSNDDVTYEAVDAMPSPETLAAWGLSGERANTLARMNDGTDGREYSFAEIADWIEANVPVED